MHAVRGVTAIDFVDHLNGQFAIALWDEPRAAAGAGARPRRHPAAVLYASTGGGCCSPRRSRRWSAGGATLGPRPVGLGRGIHVLVGGRSADHVQKRAAVCRPATCWSCENGDARPCSATGTGASRTDRAIAELSLRRSRGRGAQAPGRCGAPAIARRRAGGRLSMRRSRFLGHRQPGPQLHAQPRAHLLGRLRGRRVRRERVTRRRWSAPRHRTHHRALQPPATSASASRS